MYGKEKDADRDIGTRESSGYVVKGLTGFQTIHQPLGSSRFSPNFYPSLPRPVPCVSSFAATITLRTGQTRSTSRRTSSARTRCSNTGALEARMDCRLCT